ncbi:hypothetical protein vseg_001161 [Gypsophila vaccaria]
MPRIKYRPCVRVFSKFPSYNFDYDHFHILVHGRLLSYELLKPDKIMRKLLLNLPIQRAIFTNADKRHAFEVLQRLGLEDFFENITCFETLNLTSKDGDQDEVTLASRGDSVIFDILKYQPKYGVILPDTPVVCKPFEGLLSERSR